MPTPHSPIATRREVSFGIAAKMLLLVGFVVGATMLAGGTWIYGRLSATLLSEELANQREVATLASRQLRSDLETLRRDAASLATLPAVSGILRAKEAGGIDPMNGYSLERWIGQLRADFVQRVGSRTALTQMRLIGVWEQGRELVRVERSAGGVGAVPAALLQSKGGRAYFQDALALPAGGVFLSEIELNEEWGSISVPHVPVIRAAVPIYVLDRNPLGVVVINQDLNPTFARMSAISAGRYDLFLVDEQGRYLLHPDAGKAFGNQFGRPASIQDEFAALWNLLGENPQQAMVDLPAPAGRKLADARRVYYDPIHAAHFCALFMTLPEPLARAPIVALRNQALVWGGLLLTLTLGTVVLVARTLTGPLREITSAVESFGHDGAEVDLPIAARDEAGILARAFSEMADQVREQRVAVEREIGDRREAEEDLRNAHQQLNLALDAAQAGVWIWDIGEGHHSWDARAVSIFGTSPDPRGTANWIDLIHPSDRALVDKALSDSARSDQPFEAMFRRRSVDNGWRHIEARAIAAVEAARTPKLVGVCRDVTESKRFQERIERYTDELERKTKEMEQFVYSVSHDLKSPVVTMRGFLGILREDLEGGDLENAEESIRQIDAATGYMQRLIDGLLQLSRIGAAMEEPDEVDVGALVRGLEGILVQEHQDSEATIVVDDGMPPVFGYPFSLTRLFQNLLSNALKHGSTSSSARIEVGGAERDGEVWYYIRDNGPGIQKEHQQKIFRLFERLDSTAEGTGLGLAIASKIMGVHEGRIWVESKPGDGATFWLSFPARRGIPNILEGSVA